ncbi:uncharacterized protein LOC142991454 [Genypterus blacodes]|uniref:uncharacterized protein LOC142991454 n=1 Tax=Genypterus blacodes TaxID=154954 RepID=UPI003F77251E
MAESKELVIQKSEVAVMELKDGSSSEQTDSRETPEQQDRQLTEETKTDNVCPTAADPSDQQSKQWQPGAPCRAIFSEDGLVYPAVVLWVRGQYCRVRFDDYNNEEDQDVSGLLSPWELNGPNAATAATVREKWSHQRKTKKEEEKRGKVQTERAKATTSTSFTFPPFPLPPNSKAPMTFLTPPLPPLPPFPSLFGGQGPGGALDTDTTSLSNVLLLWYMCGFHTGCYMNQQVSMSSTKD